MDKDHAELIQYLDQKFNGIEKSFGIVANKFVTLEDILENKADKDDVRGLTNSIDAVLKRLDTMNTEFLSITNKVNRLEGWIKILADKTGIKLPS